MMKINKYNLLEKLGQGSFCSVYRGQNRYTKEFVAIKIETTSNTLQHECKILMILENVSGIPRVRNYGGITIVHDSGRYLVLDLLRPAFSETGSFTDTASGSCIFHWNSIIKTLESIHNCGVVHNDIKPSNILLRMNTNEPILSDFGLARVYLYRGKHRLPNGNVNDNGLFEFEAPGTGTVDIKQKNTNIQPLGTPLYMSPYVQSGQQIGSRRDDMISLYFTFLTINNKKQQLPWYNRNNTGDEDADINVVINYKLQILLECFKIDFYEKPDYRYISSILTSSSIVSTTARTTPEPTSLPTLADSRFLAGARLRPTSSPPRSSLSACSSRNASLSVNSTPRSSTISLPPPIVAINPGRGNAPQFSYTLARK